MATRQVSLLILLLSVGVSYAEDKCQSPQKDSKDSNTIMDQDFGLSFGPHDFLSPFMMSPMSMSPFLLRDYYRPWRRLASLANQVGSTIKTDKNQFTINLDVQHFSPEEISVKTVDGYVVIEAKHEERKDEHGSISRQFVRKYSLPEGAEAENVVSQLSSDGVLTITAPRRAVESSNERIVPITQTGPVRKDTVAEDGQCQSEVCVSDE